METSVQKESWRACPQPSQPPPRGCSRALGKWGQGRLHFLSSAGGEAQGSREMMGRKCFPVLLRSSPGCPESGRSSSSRTVHTPSPGQSWEQGRDREGTGKGGAPGRCRLVTTALFHSRPAWRGRTWVTRVQTLARSRKDRSCNLVSPRAKVTTQLDRTHHRGGSQQDLPPWAFLESLGCQCPRDSFKLEDVSFHNRLTIAFTSQAEVYVFNLEWGLCSSYKLLKLPL